MLGRFLRRAAEAFHDVVRAIDNFIAEIMRRCRPGSLICRLRAGTRHRRTGIRYNRLGFPIFDRIAKADLRIPAHLAAIQDRATHFRAATRALREAIRRGRIPRGRFTAEQLRAIFRGEGKIPGFTRHHHQHRGRMQLVSEAIHAQTGHSGGFHRWFQ